MESVAATVVSLFDSARSGERRADGAAITSPDLAALFAGADVGLALFSSDLSLLACNTLYQSLCGYQAGEAVTGAGLTTLMRLTLQRQGAEAAAIARTIETAIARLTPGAGVTFRYAAPSGKTVEVRRQRLESGTVVETVREVAGAATADLNAQFAQIAEAARTRMMHALDVMADGFALYDAQDRLIAYNRRYVDLKPLISDLIVPGASFEHMTREGVRRGMFVLNGMDPEAYVALRLRQRRNPTGPYELQLSDGRWILVNEKQTADGGTVGIRSDITEMKHREFDLLRISQQLHAKNRHFDAALNNMIQGLCMFDKDQRLIVCNRRYLDMYGFSAEIVKPGIQLRDIMKYSVSLGNYTEEEGHRALAERPDPNRLNKRTTIKQHLRDGRVIAVMNEPLPEGGSIATYQDITELETSARRMREYTTKLERSNSELQEFAYVASHDLQEPLRKIEAFGDRLNRRYATLLPDEGRMFIERMQDAAGRMRRLINDLLSYSRVTSKTKPFGQVDLARILGEVLGDLQVRIDETGAEIRSEGLPTIEADATQMRQLIQNLLSNALKFKKADVKPVITVSARAGETIAAGPLLVPSVVLTIADNGIGFDNVYKDQIFKIFQRLHGRLEYEGTGVGLATCRKIVERHLGTIDADGRSGEGATFTIILPARQPPQQDVTRPFDATAA
ncbi:MAG: PAS-domain containing protein [Hyphomicrobiaceae bacterium]|nr:PAS-domain containing protein [Hyphomicrobiaceae bacterium]